MSGITTHVLDVALGRPAAGVAISLERWTGSTWQAIASSATDSDGRCRDLLSLEQLTSGHYQLTFFTGAYFAALGTPSLYPEIRIVVELQQAAHHHLPVLISPNSYTTYKGS